MEVFAGKSVILQIVDVFLQTKVFCLHDISVRKADVAEVPGFIIDAGDVALLGRIALNETILPGVGNGPGIFPVPVKAAAGPIFDVVGIQIDGQAGVMLAVSGQGEVSVRVFLTLVVHGVLVQADLIVIAAPAGDDIDVCFSALRREGVHPLIEGIHSFLAQTEDLVLHEVAPRLFIVDAHRLRQLRVVGVIPIDQGQRSLRQICLRHLLPFPAFWQLRQRSSMVGVCPCRRFFFASFSYAKNNEKYQRQHKANHDPGQNDPSALPLSSLPLSRSCPAKPLRVSACYRDIVSIQAIVCPILFCLLRGMGIFFCFQRIIASCENSLCPSLY